MRDGRGWKLRHKEEMGKRGSRNTQVLCNTYFGKWNNSSSFLVGQFHQSTESNHFNSLYWNSKCKFMTYKLILDLLLHTAAWAVWQECHSPYRILHTSLCPKLHILGLWQQSQLKESLPLLWAAYFIRSIQLTQLLKGVWLQVTGLNIFWLRMTLSKQSLQRSL